MAMIKNRDLAAEYAKLYDLGDRAVNETGAQYRERIAYELQATGKQIEAH